MTMMPYQTGGNTSPLAPSNPNNPQQGSSSTSTGPFAVAQLPMTHPVPNTGTNSTATDTGTATAPTIGAITGAATAAATLPMYHPDAPQHLAHHYSLAYFSHAQKVLSLSKPLEERPTGGTGTSRTFYRFPFLPNEVKDLIFQHALHGPPMMHYFKLLAAEGLMTRHRNPNSTRYQWNSLSRACVVAAKTVQLARKRYMARATARISQMHEYHFDPLEDLVAVTLTPGNEADWLTSFVRISPDAFHLSIPGKSIKRVGVMYEEGKLPCVGHESARIHSTRREIEEAQRARALAQQAQPQMVQLVQPPTPFPPQQQLQFPPTIQNFNQTVLPPPDHWRMRRFHDTPARCEGPCKTAMCKLVPWFRDADVIYIMVRLTQKSLRSRDMELRLVSKWIENEQKGNVTISLVPHLEGKLSLSSLIPVPIADRDTQPRTSTCTRTPAPPGAR